jgi:aspartyl-tRNA(Asn)/glutamyl-tRNA(Gln) amidotransferase subunit A
MRTIGEAAAALRARTTTASVLADTAIAAIDADHLRTNAFIAVDAAAVRAAARTADRELEAGIDRGPLHGIPISLKDLIDEAGVVTTAGSRVLHDRIAPADAVLVTRLRAAGAVLLGRTNLHEFAMGTTSEDSAFGPVRHPGDEARVAGGSSGGSAAAVAAGMGFASIGTDTGGSIRMPAAACGVTGLKPAVGEVPMTGVLPLSPTLDHAGPIACRVQDAAWVYAALAHRPPFVVTPPPAGTLHLRRLTGYFDALDAEVRTAVEQAIARLASAGVRVTTGALADAHRIATAYADIVLPEAAHVHAPYLDTRADLYMPPVRARIAAGRHTLATAYLAARAVAMDLRREVDDLLDGADALVTATMPIVAPRLGADTIEVDGIGATTVRAAMLRHTQLFNMTGHPALTIPVPVSGLPVGLQLVARHEDTVRLLNIASAVERLLDGPARG